MSHLRAPFPHRGLYAITPIGMASRALATAVSAAIRGGASVIQYRAKDRADREEATALLRTCRGAGVPLIVNDDPELARAIGADGVHLGADDRSIAEARAIVGRAMAIGVSCYDDLSLAGIAAQQGADYVAFGSFFSSRTKPDARRAPVTLLEQARRAIAIPIVAIGGITPENGSVLLAAGADLLAVIDGIFGQSDPESAARRYVELLSNS